MPSIARRIAGKLKRTAKGVKTKVVDQLRKEAKPPRKIWIDVGAHEGEFSFDNARLDPSIRVYAFEPNLALSCALMGRLGNYVSLPYAVSETDGLAQFNINDKDVASSLLALDEEGYRELGERSNGEVDAESYKVVRVDNVPTIRLDTFLTAANIGKIDFLKVDAQGFDLAVIRSLGTRINDVRRLQIEVPTSDKTFYKGMPTRDEICGYVESFGFEVVSSAPQSAGMEENLEYINTRFKEA